ncbi:hypothetical protein MRX96_031518 [Rhipicephalus microplus]
MVASHNGHVHNEKKDDDVGARHVRSNNTVLVPRSVLSTFGHEYEGPESKGLLYQLFTGLAAACFTHPSQKAVAFLRAACVDEGISGRRAKTLTL